MKLTSITNRLFLIEDLLPQELVEQVLAVDWENVPWQRGQAQETWPRRQLKYNSIPVLVKVNEYITSIVPAIGDAIGVEYEFPDTNWWVDEPGFTVDMHTDGHLPATMQLYWSMPNNSTDYGTAFYSSKRQLDLIKRFDSIPNSGYVMLNQLNEDGSQPLQWHNMPNPVPKGTLRVSSYTHFRGYKTK
jgi:hypothetical protein